MRSEEHRTLYHISSQKGNTPNMKDLFNTAHPLAESSKPIFIPFGEWDYDGTCRQRSPVARRA